MSYGLSKSRITAFEQCPKKLWLAVHRPDAAAQDDGAEARFAAGHEVGQLACDLCAGGVMVEAEPHLQAAVAKTRGLLEAGWNNPIFEGTFVHDGVLVRVDLMLPAGDGAWHVAEVKSSTSVKGYHIGDLATQIWVLKEQGVQVASASIRHINNKFRLEQEGEYAGLLSDACLDELIEPIIAGRPAVVAEARSALELDEPRREMGDHCTAPFECEYQSYCGRDLPPPPEWPVTILPGGDGKKLARTWTEKGISDLLAVPFSDISSPKLARVHTATVTGDVYRDQAAIIEATASWVSPLHFLDFETIAFAIPRWIGTGPWRQIPFQFSCHTQQLDGQLRHCEFLSVDGSDPRRSCAEALVDCFSGEGGVGAIVAYNASFERRCLLDLAEAVPDLGDALRSIADRLVDLLPVAREHYYHRDQRGSWSIKAVLPTLCPELDYGNLGEVKSGDGAQAAYLEAIAPSTTGGRRMEIASALRAYCERDTLAMVELLSRLVA